MGLDMLTKFVDKCKVAIFQLKNHSSKKMKYMIVSLMVCSSLFVVTFAWQSISQIALNVNRGQVNPGGRLHDDFNGENKDVYVENFTDPSTGSPIFARVKLDEYMEIGEGAGGKGSKNVEVIGNPNADINDVNTWNTHIHKHGKNFKEFNENLETEEGVTTTDNETIDLAFHAYWNLEMGGKTVYMPTFNKNKDSLKADINGTYEGSDNNYDTAEDKFQDYKSYVVGEQKVGNAVYDADKNDVEDEGVTNQEETHVAKETLHAEVVTMEEWKLMGSPKGNYWVYDVDGWAYWADAIMPGEATGLLLSKITPKRGFKSDWYYGINVVGQFASAGDWGEKDSSSGFYKDGITEDALHLLNQAAGLLPTVSEIDIEGGLLQYIQAGKTTEIIANVHVSNDTGNEMEKYLNWTIDPMTGALSGNKLTPTDDMVGKLYTITASSAYQPDKNVSIKAYIYPSDAVGVVVGQKDGKKYVKYDDNTYREIKNGGVGEIGPFISAGLDETIGNSDDKYNVVVLNQPDHRFGNKFIGPDGYDQYWAMGPDGKLGTEDDIKVTSPTWPDNITNVLADEIVVKTEGNINKVTVDRKYQLSAEIRLNGQPIADQEVTWEVKGAADGKTTISPTGILSVGANEQVGRIISVYAKSKHFEGLKGNIRLTVGALGYQELPSIKPGSTQTVTIDGLEWYVLAREGNRALIWSKNPVASKTHEQHQAYLDSEEVGGFFHNRPTLKELAIPTTLHNRRLNTSNYHLLDEWDVVVKKAFLLTEADLFGTIYNGNRNHPTNRVEDYTYGAEPFVPAALIQGKRGILRNLVGLRILGKYNGCSLLLGGRASTQRVDMAENIYPAMWIKLPGGNE